jgi:hypothetical protein
MSPFSWMGSSSHKCTARGRAGKVVVARPGIGRARTTIAACDWARWSLLGLAGVEAVMGGRLVGHTRVTRAYSRPLRAYPRIGCSGDISAFEMGIVSIDGYFILACMYSNTYIIVSTPRACIGFAPWTLGYFVILLLCNLAAM